ncbi:MAG: GNAT family N-acetyltransferase [Oscillospiraceae bacterium]|nr:GNAT family N-acetyltransferase [Oscillospiraceae bacterium]
MINEIYNLYKSNLPYIVRSEEKVKDILGDKKNNIILRKDCNTLIGISVINNNTIYLLCVDKHFRDRGVGTDLLVQ